MATIGQAMFVGSDVIVRCDDNWTCCQREQAQAKVKNLDDACPCPVKKRKVSTTSKRAKKNCQSRETGRLLREMDADAAQGAKDNASSPCLAEQMEKDWKNGNQSTTDMDVQMDHPVEVKFGGPANTTLKALDTEVNNFFGGVAKNISKKMAAQGETDITSFSLVCGPPCKPPKKGDEKKDYSHGKKKAYPKNPKPEFVTPELP